MIILLNQMLFYCILNLYFIFRYDDIVSMKAELQDKDEKLLCYQHKFDENLNFEDAVQIEAERQITELFGPLNDMVEITIANVATLVESVTNIKKHLGIIGQMKNSSNNHSHIGNQSRLMIYFI